MIPKHVHRDIIYTCSCSYVVTKSRMYLTVLHVLIVGDAYNV